MTEPLLAVTNAYYWSTVYRWAARDCAIPDPVRHPKPVAAKRQQKDKERQWKDKERQWKDKERQ